MGARREERSELTTLFPPHSSPASSPSVFVCRIANLLGLMDFIQTRLGVVQGPRVAARRAQTGTSPSGPTRRDVAHTRTSLPSLPRPYQVSGKPADPFMGWGASVIDSIDTLLILGLPQEFAYARRHIREVDFGIISGMDWGRNGDRSGRKIASIHAFETIIR